MDARTAYIRQLEDENAAYQQSARLLFALAARLQAVADREGHPFDLPLLGPGCTDAMLQQMIANLQERLTADAESTAPTGEGRKLQAVPSA